MVGDASPPPRQRRTGSVNTPTWRSSFYSTFHHRNRSCYLSTTEKLTSGSKLEVPHSHHPPVDSWYRARQYSTFDPLFADLPSSSFIPSLLICLARAWSYIHVIKAASWAASIWQCCQFIIQYVIQVSIHFSTDFPFFSPLGNHLHGSLYPLSLSVSGGKLQIWKRWKNSDILHIA